MSNTRSRSATLVLISGVLLTTPFVAMACCAGDGHSPNQSMSGLGEPFPTSTDLSISSTWSVYEFERDGIRYLQINDKAGNVRAAVGHIPGTFWVLPIGSNADRVAVPGTSVPDSFGAPTSLIYRNSEVEIWRYQSDKGDAWVISSASTER